MTEERIYKLAHMQAIVIWSREHDFLIAHPENEISRAKEKGYWTELKELEAVMKEKGLK